MADGKKSFLFYANWESTFENLSNEEAGCLIKHILRYVNDRNPEAPDRITQLVFEPIKAVLKGDLNKWEDKKDERSMSGKIGNLKRWNKDLYEQVIANSLAIEDAIIIAQQRKLSLSDKNNNTAINRIANIAVNDNVNVNVNVNDTINIGGCSFNLEFVNKDFISCLMTWINYLLKRDSCYTQQIQFELFYKKLIELSNNNHLNAEKIINQAIVKNWKDIYKLDETEFKTTKQETQNGKPVFKA